MTRLTIPTILCGIVFFIPLNVLVIGDWLGSGTQWAWFRYQQTYLGSNFIFINRDLNYILDGLLGWKTGISVSIWISGLIFLILALLVSYYVQNPEGIRHAGIYAWRRHVCSL